MSAPMRIQADADAEALLPFLSDGEWPSETLASLLRTHRGVKQVRRSRVRELADALERVVGLTVTSDKWRTVWSLSGVPHVPKPTLAPIRDRVLAWMRAEESAGGRGRTNPITYGCILNQFQELTNAEQVITLLHHQR